MEFDVSQKQLPHQRQASLRFDATQPEILAPASRSFHPARLPLDAFICSDAFQFLAGLPDESVDLVVTDPPYESLELHRAKGTTTRLIGKWFHTVPNSALPALFTQLFRVLKADRHFYLFCDETTADVVKEQQGIISTRDSDGARPCKSGFRYWRELIWGKTTSDGSRIHGGMGYHYRSASERIMFFEKGKRRLNNLGIPDLLLAPRPKHKGPAVKPLGIVKTLVEQSTLVGELLLDPFAGSGVLAQAALDTGRHFWINDLDDSYLLPSVREFVRLSRPELSSVHPRYQTPAEFLDDLLGALSAGKTPSVDVVHDQEMLGLTSVEGATLVDRLLKTRPLEREALFRRFVRSSEWMRATRSHGESMIMASGTFHTWIKWADV